MYPNPSPWNLPLWSQNVRLSVPNTNYRPYWSQELQDLQDALSEAKAAAEDNPSQENNTKLKQAKAKFLRHKIQVFERGWRKKNPD